MTQIMRTQSSHIYANGKYVEKFIVGDDSEFIAITEIINCKTINSLKQRPHTLCSYEPNIRIDSIFLRVNQYLGTANDLQLSVDEIKIFSKQIGSAIAFLHYNDILHRDIKLENIFYYIKANLQETEKLHFVLGDFGSAKCGVSNSQYHTEERTTKIYRAPELFLNSTYTQNTDIWSFGICIFILQHNMVFDVKKFTDYNTLIQYLYQLCDFERNNEKKYAINKYMEIVPTNRKNLLQLYFPNKIPKKLDIVGYKTKLQKTFGEHLGQYIYSLYNGSEEDIQNALKLPITNQKIKLLTNIVNIPPIDHR